MSKHVVGTSATLEDFREVVYAIVTNRDQMSLGSGRSRMHGTVRLEDYTSGVTSDVSSVGEAAAFGRSLWPTERVRALYTHYFPNAPEELLASCVSLFPAIAQEIAAELAAAAYREALAEAPGP